MSGRLKKASAGLEQIQKRSEELLAQYEEADTATRELEASIGQRVVDGGDVVELTEQLTQRERERDVLKKAVEAARREEVTASKAVRELERQAATEDFEATRQAICDKVRQAQEYADAIDLLRFDIGEDSKALEAIASKDLRSANGRLESPYVGKIRQARGLVQNFKEGTRQVHDAAKAFVNGAKR